MLNCMEGIHYLDEKKLKRYLDKYNNQGLYQRVGYLLDYYSKEIQLSKAFIEYCKDNIGKSRRYLVSEAKGNSIYNSEWQLMVPEGLFEVGNQGGEILV